MLMVMLFLNFVFADSLDQKARVLLSATSSKVLKRQLSRLNKDYSNEIRCRFELENNLIPKSCYMLHLTAQKLRTVDQACERASIKMTVETSVETLSQKCADLVKKKNQDLIYSNEDSNHF